METVVCCGCGLVSHGEIPSEKDLQAFYAHGYRHAYHGQATPAAHRVLRAWHAGQHYLHLLRESIPPTGSVCEIGAGLGANIKAFEQVGYQAQGVEPGQNFLHYAQNRLHAPIKSGTLNDLACESHQYNLVLLIHVIEHFRSPRRALQQIHQLLAPNGQLFMECPNLAAPHAAPGRWFHFAHIHNFTPETLERLANSCGFQLERRFEYAEGGCISFLLRRINVPSSETAGDPGAAQRTLDHLFRYSTLGYYTRPRYWRNRILRDVNFISHRFMARKRARELEQNLARLAQPPSEIAPRKPASAA